VLPPKFFLSGIETGIASTREIFIGTGGSGEDDGDAGDDGSGQRPEKDELVL
jgi:hypothetical protein